MLPGTGMKWCTHCEREKPLDEFHLNLRGNPQGTCKSCHRWEARVSYRRRYRNPAFARAERARKRAEYAQGNASHP